VGGYCTNVVDVRAISRLIGWVLFRAYSKRYFRQDEHDLPAFAGGFGEARQDKIKMFEQKVAKNAKNIAKN